MIKINSNKNNPFLKKVIHIRGFQNFSNKNSQKNSYCLLT